MKNYFRLTISQSNKIWKPYTQFDNDFYVDGLNAYLIDAIQLFRSGKNINIKSITDGKLPNFSTISSDCIIVNAASYPANGFSFRGITPFPVFEKKYKAHYFALFFDATVECVDLSKSIYEPWPPDVERQPWHNKVGRILLKPSLIREKIPADLNAFTLSDWGGPFNFVVDDVVKDSLMLIKESEKLLVFEKLL